jgi:hypothetical protein
MAHPGDAGPGRHDGEERIRLAARVAGDEDRTAAMPDLRMRVSESCPQGLAETFSVTSVEKLLESVSHFGIPWEKKRSDGHSARRKDVRAVLPGWIKMLQKNPPVPRVPSIVPTTSGHVPSQPANPGFPPLPDKVREDLFGSPDVSPVVEGVEKGVADDVQSRLAPLV